MEVIGWLLIGLNVLYFFWFVFGMRRDLGNGVPFGDAVVLTPFLLILIPIVILYGGLSKFHILWLLPLTATILPAIIVRIPLINVLIAIPASMFSSILMIGVEPNNSFKGL